MKTVLFSVVTFFVCMAVLLACTIMNDRRVPPPDASTPPPPVVARDGGGPDGSCSPDAPFTAWSRLDELSTPEDEELPRLSSDELTIFYYREDFVGGATIHTAVRRSRELPFNKPEPFLKEIPGASMAAPSPNGLRVYFSVGTGDELFRLWTAERKTTTEPFANVRELTDGGGTGIHGPFLADEPGGQRLYFARFDPVARDSDLWSSAVDDAGALSGPSQPVPGINRTGAELDPTLSADGLTMYFYSEIESLNHGRIFIAHRTTVASPFGNPKPIESIPRPVDGWVGVGSISRDACRLYYYQTEHLGEQCDLWVASRTP